VISALKFSIAERLVREAARRNVTLGETIELALVQGWFMKSTSVQRTAPHASNHGTHDASPSNTSAATRVTQ
jgi:hypothetical protein